MPTSSWAKGIQGKVVGIEEKQDELALVVPKMDRMEQQFQQVLKIDAMARQLRCNAECRASFE